MLSNLLADVDHLNYVDGALSENFCNNNLVEDMIRLIEIRFPFALEAVQKRCIADSHSSSSPSS